MENDDIKYHRRKRYKGTHPKSFNDKYKELQPDKYVETIEHIIEKGNTPAGMHRPICVKEIIDFLQIKAGQKGLDATLGYGGHTLEMLKQLNHKGHIVAIDTDSIELPKTKERLENLGYGPKILTVKELNFKDVDYLSLDYGPFDFILADLGVSSMQIDDPNRGFSYKAEGPLDLRMNQSSGIPASIRLRELNQDEIEGMLKENSDEPYAAKIAAAIISEYKKGIHIDSTIQLQSIIKEALKFIPNEKRDEEIKKSCQRTFQALRIDINHEFEVLYEFLEKLPSILNNQGRVAILSFHSGEDRLVKKSFQHYFREGIYEEISVSPIRPSMDEQSSNSRARSAKLRWAIKK
ncbi:MAG: 16S rRNA (cytosine(1402)-N(4))-methyltransferase RsmH [Acholeplasmataceae bacterium]|nr:16S rRNA (cytosine(1402)-N(4))-methyltransferase RsmH [Acholeplasmataceae bacterium]